MEELNIEKSIATWEGMRITVGIRELCHEWAPCSAVTFQVFSPSAQCTYIPTIYVLEWRLIYGYQAPISAETTLHYLSTVQYIHIHIMVIYIFLNFI